MMTQWQGCGDGLTVVKKPVLEGCSGEQGDEQQQPGKEALSRDEKILNIRRIWYEVLPHWKKKKQQVRQLALRGMPSDVRGKLWPLLIDDKLHITEALFSGCLCQAKHTKNLERESISDSQIIQKQRTIRSISFDLPRTLPKLGFYQVGSPNRLELERILEAYACYRPEPGYVQGMSYVAAILLLYMDEFTAFRCLANLLDRDLHAAFYKLGAEFNYYIFIFEALLKCHLPDLYSRFSIIGLSSEIFLLEWISTIFAKLLSVDTVSRIWDVYLLEGDAFLFRVAIGLLLIMKPRLMRPNCDVVLCRKILSQTPTELIDEDHFLRVIAGANFVNFDTIYNHLRTAIPFQA